MKRMLQLLLLVTGVLMTQTISAQTEFGAKGGATFSDMTVDGLNFSSGFLEPKMIPGLSAGLYLEQGMGKGFYFAPEVNYTHKGFKVEESTSLDVFGFDMPVGVEAITRFHYIDVPLALKYKFGGDNVQAYLKAGPTFGYAVSGTVTTRLNSIIDVKLAEIDINPQGDLYNAFEVGAVVGAGIEFPTQHGKFFIDGSFSHGFTDVLDEPVIDLRVRNRAISVGIGYAFRF